MTGVNGVPHIAFLEVDKSFFPQKTFAYVKFWNGAAWALKGSGALNVNAAVNSTANSISICSEGSDLYAAWSEHTSDNVLQTLTPSQVYVAKWNGAQWTRLGNSLNVNANAWAYDVSVACLNGQTYAAWTEKTVGGEAQLFVKVFNGSNWVAVGSGSLNKDTNTGWAFRPSLTADASAGSLYLAWVEQKSLGQRAQAYVSKFSNGVWTPLGGSLNADPVLGSSQRVSLAVVGGQPVAAWGEVNFGSLRQVFVKQWDGSTWTLLNGTATPASPVPCDVNGDGLVSSLDVQAAINQSLGLAPCQAADVQQNGQCNAVDVQRIINASLGGACLLGQ
jgi:hypothetical protein